MNNLKPEVERLITAKEQRRHKLAALSFAEKVRLVVKLQQMAVPILRARGCSVRVNREKASTVLRFSLEV